jgi:hypothetical protein
VTAGERGDGHVFLAWSCISNLLDRGLLPIKDAWERRVFPSAGGGLSGDAERAPQAPQLEGEERSR